MMGRSFLGSIQSLNSSIFRSCCKNCFLFILIKLSRSYRSTQQEKTTCAMHTDSSPQSIFYHGHTCMKREVNIDWGQNKGKHVLYKEVAMGEEPLEKRQYEVLEKVSLRVYCEVCQCEVTRHAHILTASSYYCIGCFAGLEEWPEQYLVRQALNRAVWEDSPWHFMDELVLTSSLRQWGFGNWPQIRENMHYNGSVFPQNSIEQHYQEDYLKQPEQLPQLKTETLYHGGPRATIHNLNLKNYRLSPEGGSFYKELEMMKHPSKGEKKITSIASISSMKEEGSAAEPETRRERPTTQPKFEGAILGYNPKRKEFEFGEYDMSAELIIADLQFSEDDTQEQHQLKLQMIDDYNRRLTDRLRRREFVVEHRLLDSDYNFYQQHRIDGQIQKAFQPLMQHTQSHQEYESLVQDFNLMRRYEKYVVNLSRIRHKVAREGKNEEAYLYMKKKREKFIDRLERSLGKQIEDPKRQVFERQGDRLVEKEGEEIVGAINDDLGRFLTDPHFNPAVITKLNIGEFSIRQLPSSK